MKQLIICLVIPLTLAFAGCDKTTTPLDASKIDDTKKSSKHVHTGKPAAPIQLDYHFDTQPQIGIPLTITLKITPGVEANSVRVDYHADAQLIIADNVPGFEIDNLPARQSVTKTIHVIPQVAGTYYLQLTVTINSVNARSGTRSFSIPIRAGNIEDSTSLPSAVEPQTPGQETLIIQKGAETRTVAP